MRILIVSDTHGRTGNLELVKEHVGQIDMLLHLGDVEGAEHNIEEMFLCPIHMVAGNNDFFSYLPNEKEIEIGKYRIFMTHGHHYYVSMDTRLLKQEGRARGVDIVMYGHTHRPDIDYSSDVLAINPGSLSFPRQEGRKATYILMEMDDAGEAEFTLHYV